MPDPLRAPVRDVLTTIGDRAAPPRPFSALVELPVRPVPIAIGGVGRRRVVTALAAAVVLVVGVVGLRAIAGRPTSTTATVVVAPMSERTAAVPLFVPVGMALVEAGVTTSAVTAPDGTEVEAAVAVWEGSDTRIALSSSPAGLVPEPSGDRQVALRTGAIARVVEGRNGIDISWRQPDGGPTVGMRTSGLDLDQVVAVADSMWYVTPEMWDDLTDHAGFATSEEASQGYDRWTPPSSGIDRDVDLDVFVAGSLQTGFSVFVGGGSHGFSFSAEAVGPKCNVMYPRFDFDPQPLVLAGDEAVVAFELGDPDGRSLRVAAAVHPGLPQLRFAAAIGWGLSGRADLDCERSS